MTTPAEQDLQARWRPSDTQLVEAARAFRRAGPPERVFTIHVLVNKQPHVWDRHVQVRPITGRVYDDRDRAINAAVDAALVAKAVLADDTPVTAGWTAHYPDGTWAVFEEPLAISPLDRPLRYREPDLRR